MKAINKGQVIDLMQKIQIDEVENDKFSVDFLVKPTDSAKFYGVANAFPPTLPPGAYCVLWTDDCEFSDMPFVGKWINEKLTCDNLCFMNAYEGYAIAICLDLF